MAASGDAAPLSHPAAGGSWVSAVSCAFPDVEPCPTADRMLDSAPPLGAMPAQELRPGTEPSRLLAGFGAPRLGLTEWTMGSSVVVTVTGEVDIATTPQLSAALGAALRRGGEGLVCDLTGVSFLGAAGLTALLVARRQAIACRTWFDVVCPQPLPRKVIALVGLDAVLTLYDCVTDAADAQARHGDGLEPTSEPGAG